jgi:hypothetical protein
MGDLLSVWYSLSGGSQMARPTELTPSLLIRAREGAKRGLKRDLLGPYLSVNRATFYRWMQRGSTEPDSIYSEFRDAVEQGETEGAVMALDVVASAAADGDWKAAGWMLERRHGYKPQTETKVEHTGAMVIESSPMERAAEALKVLKGK